MINFKNKKTRILVVGDLMLDHYLWGKCERISPEAPVQIISVNEENFVLGGAGNVVNNLIKFGSEVGILSVVGDDLIAQDIESLLVKINANFFLIEEIGRKTTKKSRVIASQQQVIRYDSESIKNINLSSEEKLLSLFKTQINNYDLVILSDYGKGVLTKNLSQELISYTNLNKKYILVDPKGNDYTKYTGAYLLTPNKKEIAELTGIFINDEKSLKKAIIQVKNICQLKISLITLSEQGIAVFDDKIRTHPTIVREVFDVTGAGDTVIASIGFSLACGFCIDESVKFANLAAGVVVGKLGSATATLDEIVEYESSLNQSISYSHIKNSEEIAILVEQLKLKGKKIIFTNGCFDILHIGHVRYLEKAKSFGDVLIVGVNSDISLKKLKGDDRPINSEDDRIYILASLESVDYVVKFEQDTPYNLIKLINPHILVKGSDYEEKDVVGQDIVEELRLIQFVDNISTSEIINKIKE